MYWRMDAWAHELAHGRMGAWAQSFGANRLFAIPPPPPHPPFQFYKGHFGEEADELGGHNDSEEEEEEEGGGDEGVQQDAAGAGNKRKRADAASGSEVASGSGRGSAKPQPRSTPPVTKPTSEKKGRGAASAEAAANKAAATLQSSRRKTLRGGGEEDRLPATAAMETDVVAMETDVVAMETALAARETALAARETALAARETAFAAKETAAAAAAAPPPPPAAADKLVALTAHVQDARLLLPVMDDVSLGDINEVLMMPPSILADFGPCSAETAEMAHNRVARLIDIVKRMGLKSRPLVLSGGRPFNDMSVKIMHGLLLSGMQPDEVRHLMPPDVMAAGPTAERACAFLDGSELEFVHDLGKVMVAAAAAAAANLEDACFKELGFLLGVSASLPGRDQLIQGATEVCNTLGSYPYSPHLIASMAVAMAAFFSRDKAIMFATLLIGMVNMDREAPHLQMKMPVRLQLQLPPAAGTFDLKAAEAAVREACGLEPQEALDHIQFIYAANISQLVLSHGLHNIYGKVPRLSAASSVTMAPLEDQLQLVNALALMERHRLYEEYRALLMS